MKRYAHKKSIRSKILSRFLMVCIASITVSGITSTVILNTTGAMYKESAIEDLEAQMLSGFSTYVAAKSEDFDRQLNSLSSVYRVVHSYIEELYANPDKYLPTEVKTHDQMQPDEYGMYAYIPKGGDYAEFKQDAELLGNAESLIATVMKRNPQFTSIGFATMDGYALFCDNTASLVPSDFDVTGRDWFQGAIAMAQIDEEWEQSLSPEMREQFTDLDWTLYVTNIYPNLDVGGNIITFSCYVRVGDEVKGIMYTDISTDFFDTQLKQLVNVDEGYPLLVGEDRVVSAPQLLLQDDDGLPDFLPQLYEVPVDIDSFVYDEFGNVTSITNGGGYIKTDINGAPYYVVWETIPISVAIVDDGWKMAYIIPESVVSDPVRASTDAIEEVIRSYGLTGAMIQLAVMIAALIVGWQFSRRLARPIITLTDDASAIGAGDLERKIEVTSGDEIETLGDTINKMINDIKQITGEKERIGAELSVATNIQASMLPRIFPPFPERTEIDIYGSMRPAKEVGGDFYDFFFIDQNTLAMVIADVSGKGVPAALFMVIAKTLIKNNAQFGASPKHVFELVNNLLCEGNDAGMFVTAFMGYLDLTTGVFTYVNAGHNPPLIAKNGEFAYMKLRKNLFLAGMEDTNYIENSVTLEKGDIIYLYTDGVTEAQNQASELYEEQRLLDIANSSVGLPLKDLLDNIKNDIDIFADGAEQADDITMLSLKFYGKKD